MIKDVIIQYKKIFFLFGGIIVLLLILSKIGDQSLTSKVSRYLDNLGFQYDEKIGLYSKQISDVTLDEYLNSVDSKQNSDYEILYFDVQHFQLLKTKMRYFNGVATFFNPNYDYQTEKITYSYEFSYSSISVMLDGIYESDSKKFSCNINYQDNTNRSIVEEDKDVFCDRVKLELDDFLYESQTLIKNYTLLGEIKDSKK